MQSPPSLCDYCEHRSKKTSPITGRPEPRCTAYPRGIPVKFLVAERHVAIEGDEAEPVVFTLAETRRVAYERAVEAGHVQAP